MSRFLNNIFGSLIKRARIRPATQRPRRTALRVEPLEERALFSITPSMPFPNFSEGVASAEFNAFDSTGVVQAASGQSVQILIQAADAGTESAIGELPTRDVKAPGDDTHEPPGELPVIIADDPGDDKRRQSTRQSGTHRTGGEGQHIIVFDIVDGVARASARWEQIITGDLPDATYQGIGVINGVRSDRDINDLFIFRSPENANTAAYKNFKFRIMFGPSVNTPDSDIDDLTINAVISGVKDSDPAVRLTISGSISDQVRGFNGHDVLIGGLGGDAAGSSLGSEYRYVTVRRSASSTLGDGSVRLVSSGVTPPTWDADPFTAADDVVVDGRIITGDDNNHGTHVAGTIGAMGNNGIDYSHPDLYLNVWINQDEAGASDDFLNADFGFDSESGRDSDGTTIASSGYLKVKKLNSGG